MAPKSRVSKEDLQQQVQELLADKADLQAKLDKSEHIRLKLREALEQFRAKTENTTELIHKYQQLQAEHDKLLAEHAVARQQAQQAPSTQQRHVSVAELINGCSNCSSLLRELEDLRQVRQQLTSQLQQQQQAAALQAAAQEALEQQLQHHCQQEQAQRLELENAGKQLQQASRLHPAAAEPFSDKQFLPQHVQQLQAELEAARQLVADQQARTKAAEGQVTQLQLALQAASTDCCARVQAVEARLQQAQQQHAEDVGSVQVRLLEAREQLEQAQQDRMAAEQLVQQTLTVVSRLRLAVSEQQQMLAHLHSHVGNQASELMQLHIRLGGTAAEVAPLASPLPPTAPSSLALRQQQLHMQALQQQVSDLQQGYADLACEHRRIRAAFGALAGLAVPTAAGTSEEIQGRAEPAAGGSGPGLAHQASFGPTTLLLRSATRSPSPSPPPLYAAADDITSNVDLGAPAWRQGTMLPGVGDAELQSHIHDVRSCKRPRLYTHSLHSPLSGTAAPHAFTPDSDSQEGPPPPAELVQPRAMVAAAAVCRPGTVPAPVVAAGPGCMHIAPAPLPAISPTAKQAADMLCPVPAVPLPFKLVRRRGRPLKMREASELLEPLLSAASRPVPARTVAATAKKLQESVAAGACALQSVAAGVLSAVLGCVLPDLQLAQLCSESDRDAAVHAAGLAGWCTPEAQAKGLIGALVQCCISFDELSGCSAHPVGLSLHAHGSLLAQRGDDVPQKSLCSQVAMRLRAHMFDIMPVLAGVPGAQRAHAGSAVPSTPAPAHPLTERCAAAAACMQLCKAHQDVQAARMLVLDLFHSCRYTHFVDLLAPLYAAVSNWPAVLQPLPAPGAPAGAGHNGSDAALMMDPVAVSVTLCLQAVFAWPMQGQSAGQRLGSSHSGDTVREEAAVIHTLAQRLQQLCNSMDCLFGSEVLAKPQALAAVPQLLGVVKWFMHEWQITDAGSMPCSPSLRFQQIPANITETGSALRLLARVLPLRIVYERIMRPLASLLHGCQFQLAKCEWLLNLLLSLCVDAVPPTDMPRSKDWFGAMSTSYTASMPEDSCRLVGCVCVALLGSAGPTCGEGVQYRQLVSSVVLQVLGLLMAAVGQEQLTFMGLGPLLQELQQSQTFV